MASSSCLSPHPFRKPLGTFPHGARRKGFNEDTEWGQISLWLNIHWITMLVIHLQGPNSQVLLYNFTNAAVRFPPMFHRQKLKVPPWSWIFMDSLSVQFCWKRNKNKMVGGCVTTGDTGGKWFTATPTRTMTGQERSSRQEHERVEAAEQRDKVVNLTRPGMWKCCVGGG